MSLLSKLETVARIRAALKTLDDDVLVDTKEASEVLIALGRKCSPVTLRKLRCVSSTGPKFRKIENGRISYRIGELRKFAGGTSAS